MSLRDRLRNVRGDARLTIGATVGVLLVLVPSIVLVGLVATGNATDGGGIAVIVLLLAAGVWVLVDVLRQAPATPPERPVAVDAVTPRKPSATVVVLATLALLIGGTLAIAVVMSLLGDSLRGNEAAATAVVSGIVLATLAVTGWVVRRLR